tara:strand:- start:184 stop:1056 length:873 start_codon:yes stop_codon:yes gene_type:complete
MTKIKGIYAASLSILNNDLTLNIDKTINHSKYLLKNGCHGVVLFGSTGQSQLISLPEKISLINRLSMEKNHNKYIIGTGLNSLVDTINFMKVSNSLNFNYFLIMPPAYYKYSHDEVFNFYSLIIQKISNCKIILYNFEKLSGYKFSVNCVEKLVEKFPKNIIGVKDSSYNLYKKLKIKNFSIFTGSDEKLLEGLKIGNSGIITATCNVTSNIARKVYDDYYLNIRSYENKKLCRVRKIFENFNLISSLHTFMREKEEIFENLLPPLSLLNAKNKKILFDDLSKLDFNIKY